ncbi:MAG TPA: carbamoyl-phosphate synthase large subunit, partial [Clostridiaceae bacterium]
NHDKEEFLPIAKELSGLGYSFISTKGTAEYLSGHGIETKEIRKIGEAESNILTVIKNIEVDLVVNTPTKGNDSKRDGFIIRRAAIEKNIDVITTLDTVKALVDVTKKLGFENVAANMEIFNMGRKQD